jgi:NAD(P)-dependent dehydrogenase (short-subunit alcohol dehydrogenase family)
MCTSSLSSLLKLGKQSTAVEVASFYSNGDTGGFLKGKVAVLTGGNSGIGLETCKALAKEGCRVIISSRDVDAGKKALEEEVQNPGNGNYVVSDISNIVVKKLDLESMKSIKSFAEEVLAEERIDFLICNAGIMALPELQYTENGWEKQIGVNHYGHFYLTSLLKEKMMAQKHPSRIVVLSSLAYTFGPVTVSDLHFKNGREYEGWLAYGQSKLANMLFTKSLADQLANTQVQAVCLHPGIIPTNLARHIIIPSVPVVKVAGAKGFDKTIPQGAATTMYACLSPDLDSKTMSGSYLQDCAVEIPSLEAAQSKTLRDDLWDLTEREVDIAVSKI